jgi:hypothetical protein
MIVEFMLRFFPLEGNPLLGGKCIAAMHHYEYSILSEENVRERRGSYIRCVVSCIHSFVG